MSGALSPVTAWWRAIRDYWSFVHNRRQDLRFPILPSGMRLIEILAVFATAVAFVVLAIDPFFLEAVRDPAFETSTFWSAVTQLGASAWILYGTGAILIAASFFTADRFVKAQHLVWHRVFLNAWYLFSAIALSGLLTNVLKLVFARARPLTYDTMDVWLSSHLTDTYEFGSFPSGHATTAGAFAIALALLFPKLRVFFIVAGLWIAASRPGLGVHFPSDVVAGFAIGAAFSWAWARYFARKRLLFQFDDDGHLSLRGETRAPFREVRNMLGNMKSHQNGKTR